MGCGGGKNEDTGKIHIKLVHFYTDHKDLWQNNVVAEFEKLHPNIDVEVEAIPFGLYTSKIQSAAAAGTKLGDVVLVDDWFGQELFKRDYTIPLDSLFARDFKQEDFFYQFFTVWRKGNTPNAQLMAMPACGGVTALFYNKDLFDQYKLSYPDSTWTYDTYLTAAQKLTNSESDVAKKTWGTLVDDGQSTGIDTYIYSNGGRILSADLHTGALMEPASIAAVQNYVDLVQKYKVAPAPDPSQGMAQRFQQGKFGMMLTFDAAKQELKNAKFKWDVVAPPKGSAGLMDRQNGNAFAIAKLSEHPQEAWELIKFIVTLPTKKGINELFYTSMPLYKPLANSPEYLEGEPKCNRRALLEINNGHVFTLITPGWQEWRDHGFIPNMQDMLAGRKTVQQGLAAANEKINSVLSRAYNK